VRVGVRRDKGRGGKESDNATKWHAREKLLFAKNIGGIYGHMFGGTGGVRAAEATGVIQKRKEENVLGTGKKEGWERHELKGDRRFSRTHSKQAFPMRKKTGGEPGRKQTKKRETRKQKRNAKKMQRQLRWRERVIE